MTLASLRIEGYRSIRAIEVGLAPITVLLGGNGAGKSNVMRGLELLRAAAEGGLSRMLAEEGGRASIPFAATPWRDEEERGRLARAASGPVRLTLGAAWPDIDYTLTLGAPRPTDAALSNDLVVKEETARLRARGRWLMAMRRKGPALLARGAEGRMEETRADLLLTETALAELRDPAAYPALGALQRRMAGWRFHAGFRTDAASPLRLPQPMTCAPLLDPDGANWAAVLRTLADVGGDMAAAAEAVADAFPGGALAFGDGTVLLETREFRRPFAPPEMSDGTLRFLVLVAALASLRRPSLIALNEPETSLNEALIEPLARLIGRAAGDGREDGAQVVLATHSERLAETLELDYAARVTRLVKVRGETRIEE